MPKESNLAICIEYLKYQYSLSPFLLLEICHKKKKSDIKTDLKEAFDSKK